MRSTLRRGAVAGLGVAAVLSLGIGSAVADPNLDHQGGPLDTGFLPDADDLVGTGSDTTQYLTTTLAWAYEPPAGSTARLASFNAFQPGTEANPVTGDLIQIRPGISIPRPNGSSAGVEALVNNPELDFARSSRGPRDTEGDFTFVPFASDGLSYVIDDANSAVPTNLTAADLAAIYTCQVSGFNPKLPQSGSGTREFFLGEQGINVAESEIGACVEEVQEHDPSPVDGDPLALAPMSSARYTSNPPDETNPPSAIVTLASGVDSGAFSVSRDVYHVVRNADAADPDIQSVFGPDGYICQQLAGGFQGFQSIGARCGSGL